MDQEQLFTALNKLSDEDPTFVIRVDQETGQPVISGMGELHLEILLDRLFREFKVEANVGKPQVAYKEGLGRSVEATGRFVRQSGGRGQYGHVEIELEPAEPGSGLVFESKITGGSIPREYISSVQQGIQEAMTSGPVASYPVEDVRVTLIDGSYHEVDSSEMASKAKAFLMEPVMDLEVVVPEQYLGDVIGDLTSHRGEVQGVNARSDAQVVVSRVPLSETFGYATRLRSLTQGRAVFTMQFAKYDRVPAQITEEIVESAKG